MASKAITSGPVKDLSKTPTSKVAKGAPSGPAKDQLKTPALKLAKGAKSGPVKDQLKTQASELAHSATSGPANDQIKTPASTLAHSATSGLADDLLKNTASKLAQKNGATSGTKIFFQGHAVLSTEEESKTAKEHEACYHTSKTKHLRYRDPEGSSSDEERPALSQTAPHLRLACGSDCRWNTLCKCTENEDDPAYDPNDVPECDPNCRWNTLCKCTEDKSCSEKSTSDSSDDACDSNCRWNTLCKCTENEDDPDYDPNDVPECDPNCRWNVLCKCTEDKSYPDESTSNSSDDESFSEGSTYNSSYTHADMVCTHDENYGQTDQESDCYTDDENTDTDWQEE